MELVKIQQELKAPKNQTNTFGKYKYRSAEDIIEAVKPIAHKYGFALILDDNIVEIGGCRYVKALAVLSNGNIEFQATGWAREEDDKKGMDAAQMTGSASSYARKYALNGLLAIDDTKDSDATNTHGKEPKPESKPKAEPKKGMMNDVTFLKLVARFNGGEKDVFERAQEHFEFRHTDLVTIKTLQNG